MSDCEYVRLKREYMQIMTASRCDCCANALEIMRREGNRYFFSADYKSARFVGPKDRQLAINTGIHDGRRGGSMPDKRIIRIIRSPDDALRCAAYLRKNQCAKRRCSIQSVDRPAPCSFFSQFFSPSLPS